MQWKLLDKTILFCTVCLMVIGLLSTISASQTISDRIVGTKFYIAYKQIAYFILAIVIMLYIVSLDTAALYKKHKELFYFSVIVMILLPFIGNEIKGSKRWINLFGISLQPSEFIKPSFIIVNGIFIAANVNNFYKQIHSVFVCLLIIFLLLIQPDVGNAILILGIWLWQMFILGMPILYIITSIIGGLSMLTFAYFFMPHFTIRMNKFLYADSENYQIHTALNAFKKGGLFGVGPGEGMIKNRIPDAHSDFIFAVIGEEFGIITCIAIIILFGIISIKCVLRMMHSRDIHHIAILSGLVFQICLQMLINVSSTLHLIPTKGMTLPFISCGGSSIISTAICVGTILNLMRKKQ